MKARYDRAAVMRDAHKRFRDGKRLGLDWSFGRCLSTAWQAAKMRQGEMRQFVVAQSSLQADSHADDCQNALTSRLILSAETA